MAQRQTYTWNNTVLSPAQIAQVIRQAGITDNNVIAQLVSIAQRESGGRAGVHGSASPQSQVSGDRGLFQINYVHDRALMAAGIIHSPQDLFNPVINARAAAYLSHNGDPGTMRQLWGAAGGTWTGSGGGFPPPNYGAVQQAQQAGLFNSPYAGGSGGGYGGGIPAGQNASNAYYNQLYGDYNTQLALNSAMTQGQIGNAQQQQAYANQLAGYQQQGLDLQGQQLDLENSYQNDLALLNRGLNKTQQEANLKDWQGIAKNIAALQEISLKGLTADKGYHDKTVQLEKDILAAAKKWAGQQKGFNAQDYHLALDALKNVVTTEATKRTQARQEAAFTHGQQTRAADSDAVKRGAMTSVGHAEDLGAFQRQNVLANSAAEIPYQDALRQTKTAGQRALLDYNKTNADIGHQYQGAGFDYRGNINQANNQYTNARLSYMQNNQNLAFQRTQAHNSYDLSAANLTAQGQMAARTQAYNNALYGINQAQLANTGAGYGVQNAAQRAATGWQTDLYGFQGAQNVTGINAQRQATQYQQVSSYDPGSPTYGGGYGGGSSYSPYSTSRRSSGTGSSRNSGYQAQAG